MKRRLKKLKNMLHNDIYVYYMHAARDGDAKELATFFLNNENGSIHVAKMVSMVCLECAVLIRTITSIEFNFSPKYCTIQYHFPTILNRVERQL